MPMSVTAAKKSLVSAPGVSVMTPWGEAPWFAPSALIAADKNRHFRRGERQELGTVDEEFFR